MSVSKLIEGHKKNKELSKEEQQEKDELVGELVTQLETKPAPPKPPPKKRGRPSKSPTPRQQEWERNETKPEMPVNEVADRLKKRKIVRELRMLRSAFPEILNDFLSRIDPYNCSYKDLENLLASCKDAVRDDADANWGPAMGEQMLETAESVLISIAVQNQDNYLGNFMHLKNFTEEAKKNRAIETELKILGCEMTSFLPDNPFLRLAVNLFQVATTVFHKNQAIFNMDQVASESNFKDF